MQRTESDGSGDERRNKRDSGMQKKKKLKYRREVCGCRKSNVAHCDSLAAPCEY